VCIYNVVCCSLVALFLWQQVTNIATVIAHCAISPNRYASFIKFGHVFELFVGLCNLRELCVSNMVVPLAEGYEVQLSFHLILWAVCT
jgi:hypothetical protein